MSRQFVTMGIRDWETLFLHRLSNLRAQTGRTPLFVICREDHPNHQPYNGRIPKGTVFFHTERDQTDPAQLAAVVTCHPDDREAVENRLKDPRSRTTIVAVEPAPGRNEGNV